ncbi:MAG: hypothetical protein PHQ00_01940 [Phycisphaerae bacterium]|nr:hypothetical protein [Phycisphaerae bacterium]
MYFRLIFYAVWKPSLLKTDDGEQAEFVNNPQKILIERKLPAYSILRRIAE